MAKVLIKEGVERETLAVGNNLMIVKITFKKGVDIPWHKHEHEQSSYILKGSLKLLYGDKEIVLNEGMSEIIPSNVEHKAVALEDTIDINSFTPIREDYL